MAGRLVWAAMIPVAISPAILPIPGTSNPQHAEENVAAAAVELSAQEVEAISKGG